VEVIPGENAILIIAGNHPNRIITPFESPVVHTTSQAKFEVIGSVIYVTASLDAGPSTLFVTEEDDETMALSLTLVPKAIPPKEIHLKLKHPQFIQISSPKAKKWEASLPYVDMLKNVITKIAKGEIPPGYNLRNITSYDPVPVCETNISLEPKQVIDGHRIQVIISRATNITNKKMLFNEASCYQNKVLAVAVWPNALLEPGQSTELYVIFKKEYGRQHSKRPSLVQ
jgi:conjugal transfer pilus assembly protein TraK